MSQTIVLIFLGDFFFDARCINMADTIIDAGVNLNIIDAGKTHNQYRGRKIYHISIPKRGLIRYIQFYHKTKKVITQINPQKIIAGDLYSLPAAAAFKDAFIIYDSREIYTQLTGLTNNPLKQAFWSLIEYIYINKEQSVLVTAEGDGVILKNLYGDINIFHIYNFPSVKMKPEGNICLRDKLNIPKESKIFLYQGILHKGRGIKAMIQLLKKISDSHAVIIGDGPYRGELQSFSKKMNLEKNIHFIGKIPYKEILEWTTGADIGFSLIKPISQSYRQALPNKIFEYALANVPVIASNLPEMEIFIKQFSLGLTVPYNDINKQKEAVNKLLYQKKKNTIQETAEKYLVWEEQKGEVMKALKINA